jgi:hypothetical protein
MQVDLTTLPRDIYIQIPRSITSYKNIYTLSELPSPIQYLIKSYFERQKTINYGTVYDIVPEQTAYADFRTITTVEETVALYVKNFFQTTVGDYPFDATLGTKLKWYLQSKDTSSSKQLILVIGADLGANVSLVSLTIDPISQGAYTEYFISVEIKINNKTKQIGMSVVS